MTFPPPPRSLSDPDRLAALAASGLMQGRQEVYDRYARLAATILGTPLASVAGVSDTEQRFAGKVGFPTDGGSIHGSICREVVGADDLLMINDLRLDARTRDMAYDPMLVAYLGAPIRDEDGVPVGSVCGVDTKVRAWTEEQRQAIEDLAATLTSELAARATAVRADAEAARVAAVLVSAPDAVVIFDADAAVIEFSPAAERLFRRSAAQVSGLPLTQLLAGGGTGADGTDAALAERLALIGRTEVEATRGDGSSFPAEIMFSSVDIGDGQAFACFVRDVTEARALDAERRAEQDRFREIIESSPTVTWLMDPAAPDTLTYVSPQVESLTGHPPGRFTHEPGFWADVTHPVDRERVSSDFERATATDGGGDFTYRILHADGSIVWVWTRLTRIPGEPTFRGITLDVTGHHAAEQRLRAAHEQMKAVVQSAPMLLLGIDRDGIITSADGGAIDSLGMRSEDLVGADVVAINVDDPVAVEGLKRALAGEAAAYSTVWNGARFGVQLRPVVDDGELVGVVGVSTNLTEARRGLAGYGDGDGDGDGAPS